MAKSSKNCASKNAYISPSQITIEGFESLFGQELDSNNRWVKLSKQIPWDLLVKHLSITKNLSQMPQPAHRI